MDKNLYLYRYLFMNRYYYSLSGEKERNIALLYNFLYHTDYDDFNIYAYVIALSLFTDQKNFRNDIINLSDYSLVNDILNDFFSGNNNIYNINREELKTIVELCNSYRLSKEDNAKIIRQYTEYNEEYKNIWIFCWILICKYKEKMVWGW